ncbi:MAG: hypothetical protein HQK54_11900, partial [Oligoflexales bacterium]|nr:hypothetical protein [Oligoflexales bacterium]
MKRKPIKANKIVGFFTRAFFIITAIAVSISCGTKKDAASNQTNQPADTLAKSGTDKADTSKSTKPKIDQPATQKEKEKTASTAATSKTPAASPDTKPADQPAAAPSSSDNALTLKPEDKSGDEAAAALALQEQQKKQAEEQKLKEYDPAKSTIFIIEKELTAGVAVSVNVNVRNGKDEPLATGQTVAIYIVSEGKDVGTLGNVVNLGEGKYAAQFEPVKAGESVKFAAKVNNIDLSAQTASYVIKSGPFNLATSTIESEKSTIAAGFSSLITLILKDKYGNIATEQGAVVKFSISSGSSNGSFSQVTGDLNGTYKSTFTGEYAGTAAMVTASINDQELTGSPASITVTPGEMSLAKSMVSISSGTVKSGSSTPVTLILRDAFGNQLQSGGATVGFKVSGNESYGNFSEVTDHQDGSYSATFTGVLAGSSSISAEVFGFALQSQAPSIQIEPGPASRQTSVVTVSSNTVNSGNSVTATLIAKDNAGNRLASGGLVVGFSYSGSGSGSFADVIDNGDGSYTSQFSAILKGEVSINASIGGEAVTSAPSSLNILPGSCSLSKSIVSTSSSSVVAGNYAQITLTANDEAGNRIETGGLAVVFGFENGTSSGDISSATDNNNGTYGAGFAAVRSGSAVTLKATINGQIVMGLMPQITVLPGPCDPSKSKLSASASTVIAGGTVNVLATLFDAFNNNITSGGRSLMFMLRNDGTSSGAFSSTNDNSNGSYSAIFTGETAGTARTLTATVDGSEISGSNPKIQVLIGPPSEEKSTVSISAATIISGRTVGVTFTSRDRGGNLISSGGHTVVFSYANGTSTGNFSSAIDNGNGTYSATFLGITAGTPIDIRASLDGRMLTTQPPKLTVNPGAAVKYLVEPKLLLVNAGKTMQIKITAMDLNNNNATDYVGDALIQTTDTKAEIPANVQFVTGDAGSKTIDAIWKTAGIHSITVKDSVNNTISGSYNGVQVLHGISTKMVFTGAASSFEGRCGKAIDIYFQDQFGNASPIEISTTISLSRNGSSGDFYEDSACSSKITSVN